MSFLFSVIIIPDCHLTAFILDTVGALIKNTLFKKKKNQLSFCLSSLWLPPDPFAYLNKKVDAGWFSEGRGVDVSAHCICYLLSPGALAGPSAFCYLWAGTD